MADKPDTRNTKHKLKAERQEAMREQLRNYGLIQQVIETVRKVEDAAGVMEPAEIQAHKFVTETRLKLINKYLPDQKEVELSFDEENNQLVMKIERVIVDARNKDSDA